MAEKLRLGNEVKELKIGQSFTNPKSAAFHTVRYDFKPASVDTSKKATVHVGQTKQISVTVPHLDGSSQTEFRGSQRNYTKECVLIIDRVTGEITLEKLACNIQVKKTRSEYNKAPLPQERLSQQSHSNNDRSAQSSSSQNPNHINSNITSRSSTPPVLGHRVSSKTRVTSGSRRPDRPITQLVPKHSPLHASPSYPSPKSSSNVADSHNTNNQNHSTLASLPMIGMDDFTAPPQSQTNHNNNSSSNNISSNSTLTPYMATSQSSGSAFAVGKSPTLHQSDNERSVGEITDTSSSGSSDSDSDSDVANKTMVAKNGGSGSASVAGKFNGYSNGNANNSSLTSKMILDQDLCLSESGSDSD